MDDKKHMRVFVDGIEVTPLCPLHGNSSGHVFEIEADGNLRLFACSADGRLFADRETGKASEITIEGAKVSTMPQAYEPESDLGGARLRALSALREAGLTDFVPPTSCEIGAALHVSHV